jgi:hypothetical protein
MIRVGLASAREREPNRRSAMNVRAAAAMLAMAVGLGARSQAAELFVSAVCGDDASGNGARATPFATIGRAMTAANAEDTIWVLPSADMAATCPPLTSYANTRVTKDVCIIAEAGPQETRSAGFVINPDLNVTIRGFTITNSEGNGIEIPTSYSSGTPQLIVENCVIHACAASGIRILRARVSVRNCIIAGCGRGGLLIINGAGTGTLPHQILIENSIFLNNILPGFPPYNIWWQGACVGDSDPQYPVIRYCYLDTLATNCPNSSSTLTRVIQPRAESPTFVNYDPTNPNAGCDFRLTGSYLNRESSKGNPACIYQNPDGTRNTIGAFGGPGSLGFYPQSGPQILQVEIEPTADAGRVRVRVLTREP